MLGNWNELNAIVATIDPDAYTAAAYSSDEIPLANFSRVTFIVMAGTLGSSATLDFAVHGATSLGGSYNAISGYSITQLTQAGTDDDKQAIVEVSAEAIQALGTDLTHIKGVMTVGTATSDCGMIAIASRLRYGTARDYDLSSVDEIVEKVH